MEQLKEELRLPAFRVEMDRFAENLKRLDISVSYMREKICTLGSCEVYPLPDPKKAAQPTLETVVGRFAAMIDDLVILNDNMEANIKNMDKLC